MTSIARPPRPIRRPQPTRRPQPKKDTSLEAQLSALRSQTSLWNIGDQVRDLELQIQKKRMML